MAKVKFYRTSSPTGSIEFTRYVGYGGQAITLKFLQPSDRSDGGDRYVYDKGTERFMTFSFTRITEADYQSLMYFLSSSVVNGSVNSFTVIDPAGDVYTCMLGPDQELSFPPASYNSRTGELELIIVAGAPEYHIVDDSGDIAQRQEVTGIVDSFFELDSNGDVMPRSSITDTSMIFALDANSDVQLDLT